MGHAPDAVLRRLEDEPFAIADSTIDHVAACPRCRARRADFAADRARSMHLLSSPQLVPDVGVGWSRFQRARSLSVQPDERARQRITVTVPARRTRLWRTSARTSLVVGVSAVVLAGSAAAGTLTTVFAPTQVAPVPVDGGALQAVAALMGTGDRQVLGGFAAADGTRTLPFGTIYWSSSGQPQIVGSARRASADTGLAVSLPRHLPSGVGRPLQVLVRPRVSATVSFDSAAGDLAGSTVTLNAGPAVAVEYGSATGTSLSSLPTLGIVTMPRPSAITTGATIGQIEAFLLARPGISPELAEEVRLLGDLGTTLPIPTPAGAVAKSVQIGDWPGVLISDSSNAVSGVVWEDGGGTVHVVAGILDQKSTIDVADQLA
jgi:hypothetical protein